MTSDIDADSTGDDSIKEKRLAVLDDVEEIYQIAKSETGRKLAFIRANINIAENNLLDDDEYNYAVRFALLQLHQAVARAEDSDTATVERIERYRSELVTKAEVPPPDQLER